MLCGNSELGWQTYFLGATQHLRDAQLPIADGNSQRTTSCSNPPPYTLTQGLGQGQRGFLCLP